ncbi:MAG: DUF2905 domain-containing protein [Firmicutes bacterium]|jgi:hypothetical protein|nr:DUF2905 domain-containing protein [Bacillota bacterium]
MMPFEHMGRMLVFVGLVLAGFGLLMMFGGRLPGFGRLPGDIVVRRGNFTFYFPIVTCIAVSIVLSLIGWIVSRR